MALSTVWHCGMRASHALSCALLAQGDHASSSASRCVCAERPELSPPAAALRLSPALRSASFDGESPWASLRGTRSRVRRALAPRADTAGSTIRVSPGDSGGSQRVVRIVRSASRIMETGWTSFECHSTQKKSRRNQLEKASNTMKRKGKARESITQETQLIGSFRSALFVFFTSSVSKFFGVLLLFGFSSVHHIFALPWPLKHHARMFVLGIMSKKHSSSGFLQLASSWPCPICHKMFLSSVDLAQSYPG